MELKDGKVKNYWQRFQLKMKKAGCFFIYLGEEEQQFGTHLAVLTHHSKT